MSINIMSAIKVDSALAHALLFAVAILSLALASVPITTVSAQLQIAGEGSGNATLDAQATDALTATYGLIGYPEEHRDRNPGRSE